jgi:hypothetical protein
MRLKIITEKETLFDKEFLKNPSQEEAAEFSQFDDRQVLSMTIIFSEEVKVFEVRTLSDMYKAKQIKTVIAKIK